MKEETTTDKTIKPEGQVEVSASSFEKILTLKNICFW
jgi:hypothetical protein